MTDNIWIDILEVPHSTKSCGVSTLKISFKNHFLVWGRYPNRSYDKFRPVKHIIPQIFDGVFSATNFGGTVKPLTTDSQDRSTEKVPKFCEVEEIKP